MGMYFRTPCCTECFSYNMLCLSNKDYIYYCGYGYLVFLKS